METATKKRRIGSTVLGLLVSATLLAILFTQLDIRQAWRTIVGLDPRLLWLPAVFSAFSLPIRPLRWQWMFRADHRPRFWTLFRAFWVSMFANNFLPARGGDVLRCFIVGQDRSLKSASRVLGTLGVEKVLDGLALLVVTAVSLLFMTATPWLTYLVLAAAFIFGGAFCVLILLQRQPKRVGGIVTFVLGKLRLHSLSDRINALIESFAEGLSAVGSLRSMIRLTLITAIAWSLEAGFVWAIARTLHVPLTLSGSAMVTAVLGLAMMIPAAPGYVGTYEASVCATVGLLGVGSEQGLALALVLHAWVLIITTGSGLACLASTGLKAGLRGRNASEWDKCVTQGDQA